MKENKLIAEFMGIHSPLGDDGWIIDYEGVIGDNKCYLDLKFHESWDWLMPVVQKVEAVNEGVPSELWNVSLYSYHEEVYDAVVEFIKGLNK